MEVWFTGLLDIEIDLAQVRSLTGVRRKSESRQD